MRKSDKIIFIVGPTAIGKSDVAVSVAKKIPAEIVSCDSMQIYREIHVASNKPAAQARKAVRHHMIGVVSVEEEYHVGLYNEQAVSVIDDILSRGKMPIIAGGSGMYMQVLLDGIFQGPGENKELRRQLGALAEKKGVEVLHQRLIACDPAAAQKIHPHDQRRLIRALEVFELTKVPISERQKDIQGLWGKADILIFCLNMERKLLYKRINERVDAMFERGIVDEVRGMSFERMSKTAKSVIGVQEIHGFLQGRYDCARSKEMMRQNTRRLAKRQLTWFRRDKRIHWIEIQHNESADVIAARVIGQTH